MRFVLLFAVPNLLSSSRDPPFPGNPGNFFDFLRRSKSLEIRAIVTVERLSAAVMKLHPLSSLRFDALLPEILPSICRCITCSAHSNLLEHPVDPEPPAPELLRYISSNHSSSVEPADLSSFRRGIKMYKSGWMPASRSPVVIRA